VTRIDHYRAALLPANGGAPASTLLGALKDGGSALLENICEYGLGAWWHHALQAASLLDELPPDTANALRAARAGAAASYLAQREGLERVDRQFDAARIPYAVMKGAHVRECVYPDPSLRVSGDVDVLVTRADRHRAARLLHEAGYTHHENRTTISHEASFVRSPVDIDLHWDILRPGRTRRPMAEDMLARRQRVGGFWALSDSDALFVMLTHPAFAKYVCSPNMGLLQVADFLLWSEAKPEAWTAAERLLDAAGLRTAAWTMLGWYGTLATPAHASRIAEWRRRLQPGRLRAAYLEYWLAHDLPGRWLDRPLRIQLGLTLWLHDRPSDALRAARGWLGSRLARSEDARSLLAGA